MNERVIDAIEHVAIAVRDVDMAIERYTGLGFESVQVEDLPGAIRSHLVRSGSAYLEILEPLSGDSELTRFLDRHGEGMHHVCFRVTSLDATRTVVLGAGCHLVNEEPAMDLRGRRVFVHPASNQGVLMGLVEPHASDSRAG